MKAFYYLRLGVGLVFCVGVPVALVWQGVSMYHTDEIFKMFVDFFGSLLGIGAVCLVGIWGLGGLIELVELKFPAEDQKDEE